MHNRISDIGSSNFQTIWDAFHAQVAYERHIISMWNNTPHPYNALIQTYLAIIGDMLKRCNLDIGSESMESDPDPVEPQYLKQLAFMYIVQIPEK